MHETELLNATKTAIFLFQMTFHNIIFILYLHIQVTIKQTHQYEASSDTYSQTSAEAEASYGGLFYSGSVSGGFTKKTGNSSLTKEGSDLEISFKVRKVLIERPWMEPNILQYTTLGIKEMKHAQWSTGSLNPKTNKGSFPILPTACIVAKDVVIHAGSFSDKFNTTMSSMSAHASAKVRKTVT